MTTEEKFNAAVNVIRSLPKNGKQVCLTLLTPLLFTSITIVTHYVSTYITIWLQHRKNEYE